MELTLTLREGEHGETMDAVHKAMNQPTKLPANPSVESETSQEDVELNDSELQEINGGAFDAWLNFPPAPHP